MTALSTFHEVPGRYKVRDLSLAAAAIGLLPADARRELRLPTVPPVTNRVLGQLGTRTIRWAMSSGHEQAAALQRETASRA